MKKEKDATAVDIKDEVKTDEQVNIKPEKSPSKFKESFKKKQDFISDFMWSHHTCHTHRSVSPSF